MIDGLIGLLGVFSIILAVVVKGIIGLILLNCGIIGLVFFSWPALGLLFINLIAKTGKAHPSVNEEQINSIPNPMILDIGCGSGRVAI